MYRWREKLNIRNSEGGKERSTSNKKKVGSLDWSLLARNGLLGHVIEGKMQVTEIEKEDVSSYWMT